jgi:HlyD family secretion protein
MDVKPAALYISYLLDVFLHAPSWRPERNSMRVSFKIVAGVAAVIVVGTAITAFVQLRPLPVDVLRAHDDVPITAFGLGTVEARVLSRIGFKVAGTISDLRADHGDSVKAGQVLAQIDASEQETRLAKSRAQVASAEAAIQVAQASAKKSETLHSQRAQVNRRRQSLLERQSASQEAADDAQANEAVAAAELLVARSDIEAARAKRDDALAQHETDKVVFGQHQLKAPFDAVVVSRAKELGSVLAAGETLFTLVAPETVWILAYVDEARAGDIAVGQPAEIRLRSLPQRLFRGHVTRIGVESDRVNEERRINVACDDCPKEFVLGEQAEVFITKARLAQAIMIPEALIDGFDGAAGTIWVIADGRLARRRVAFGLRAIDGRVELRGLPAGMLAPATVTSAFREGRAVRVSEDGAR